MKKILLNDIKKIHLELSSYCNLKCPFCARISRAGEIGINKNLSKKSIDNLLTYDFASNLVELTICGNFGEPTFNQNIFYMIEKLYVINPGCDIWISTNGSTHTDIWWKIFGEFSKHKNVEVCFCIDGVTDNGNRYRKSSLNKVFNNLYSYIENGGNASIKTIVFKHNQDEVKLIRKIAEENNIKHTLKYSWDYENEFEKPTMDFPEVQIIHNNTCSFLNDGQIYVSAMGEVLPCCYYIEEFYKYPHLLLEDYTIDEIVKSANFQVFLLHADKTMECKKHCG